jgi:3-phenylpropionate/trans-cinnamate dioxygenase ferredoxin reductase subunit
MVAERQGQAVAKAMLGRLDAYRVVPFFWTTQYDLTISYIGHAKDWDRIVIKGSLEKQDALVAYFKGERVMAAATLGRDHLGLEIEAAMERGDDQAERPLVDRV